MPALVRSGSSVVLREVPDPVPLSHEAIVRVNTVAVTRRDLLDLAGAWPTAGFGEENVPEAAVPGRDFAGTLVQYPAAINPTATFSAVLTARVVGTVPRGAWAELVAVPYTRLAGLPDNVGDVFGSTLPTPGLDHLLCRPDLIIDTVGGEILGEAIESLEPGSLLVSVATPTRDAPVSFRTWRRDRSAGARIVFLDDLDEVTAHDTLHADLVRLVRLVAEVKLDLGVEVERPWQEAAEVLDAVRERRIKARAVLRILRYAP